MKEFSILLKILELQQKRMNMVYRWDCYEDEQLETLDFAINKTAF